MRSCTVVGRRPRSSELGEMRDKEENGVKFRIGVRIARVMREMNVMARKTP